MNANREEIHIDDLRLDPRQQTVKRGSKTVDMAGLSFRVLRVLADHWPNPVSNRNLTQEVWGDVIISDDTLRQRIRLLRQSLGRSDYIATVKGVGYRLSGPVRAQKSLGRRRQFVTAATILMICIAAYYAITGDAILEIGHTVRHAIRH